MEHSHTHSHSHSHALTAPSLGTAFVVGTVLNLLFVLVEGGAGIWSNSMGLLSDAGHNLSDTVSLLLAWFAFRLTRVAANKHYTYGYGRSTILVSLVNACILLVAIGAITVESIRKFTNPQPIQADVIIWVAAAGVVVNLATTLLFMKDRKKDLNVKGAFLHMAMDTLVSAGVVVSGIIIKFTGWTVVDPIIGLAIAVIIFLSTWSLLKQSMRLSLDGVPQGIDVDDIQKVIDGVEGVTSVHHLHIWALDTSKNALTTHISVDDTAHSERIKNDIRNALAPYGITHVTVETEPAGYHCEECQC